MSNLTSQHSEIPHTRLCPDMGASFGTHVLSTELAGTWRFTPSLGARAFAATIGGLGIIAVIMGVGGFLALKEAGALLIAVVGAGCVWAGSYLYQHMSLTREIDFLAQRVRFPKREFFKPAEILEIGFDKIRALQIVEKLCKGSDQNFYSYELNLVLENGERVNLLDHGNGERLIKEATRIAERLGKDLIVEEYY